LVDAQCANVPERIFKVHNQSTPKFLVSMYNMGHTNSSLIALNQIDAATQGHITSIIDSQKN
jgi:hypothetical protein